MAAQNEKNVVTAALEASDRLNWDELRGVYSKLFTHPSDPSGSKNRKAICAVFTLSDPKAAKAQAEQLLSQHYSNAAGIAFHQCTLHPIQWDCIKKAFTADAYKSLRDIENGAPRVPNAQGVLDAGPWELAFIYHSLFGKKEDDPTVHTLLHRMKHDARSSATIEQKRMLLMSHLKDAYNNKLPPQTPKISALNVSTDVVDEMIMMLTDDNYKSLEPFSGTEPCLMEGSKAISCY